METRDPAQGWGAPPPAPAPPPTSPVARVQGQQDERTWATLAHVAALSAIVFAWAGAIVGPLLVWLFKRQGAPFVDHHGKEAVNFQITMAIVQLVFGMVLFAGMILSFVLIGIPFLVLGLVGLVVAFLLSLVFAIVGAVKANEGVWYRYPMTWRFIR